MNLFWKILLLNLLVSAIALVGWLWYVRYVRLRRVDELHERLDELEHVVNYRPLTPEEKDEWRALSRELDELT